MKYEKVVTEFRLGRLPTVPTQQQFDHMISNYHMAVLSGDITALFISNGGDMYFGAIRQCGYVTKIFINGDWLEYSHSLHIYFVRSLDNGGNRINTFHQYVKEYFANDSV